MQIYMATDYREGAVSGPTAFSFAPLPPPSFPFLLFLFFGPNSFGGGGGTCSPYTFSLRHCFQRNVSEFASSLLVSRVAVAIHILEIADPIDMINSELLDELISGG